ncbi:hypothetical protein T01_9827 [Trichinella spiralis]|uniref:Uncharacterized protein n=1 Tax=Trichinella spiralis TaxID=6334 RepID=A0A0V1BYB3_TRISP|nr:hypothetical protein T01_9827 [Trichinella spiralis]
MAWRTFPVKASISFLSSTLLSSLMSTLYSFLYFINKSGIYIDLTFNTANQAQHCASQLDRTIDVANADKLSKDNQRPGQIFDQWWKNL